MTIKLKYIIFVAITIIGVMSDKAGYTTVPAGYHFSETVDFTKTVEMENQTEIWKTIEGFENYQISSLGRVKSLSYQKTNKEGILKQTLNCGYLKVSLFPGYKCKTVHRLMAEAFILNSNNKPYVCHKNDISTDNRLDNLYWGTQYDNMSDRSVNGYLHSKETKKKIGQANGGENHPKAKLTENNVVHIKHLLKHTKMSHKEISVMFNVNSNTISYINIGKNWKHVKI